MKKEKWFKCFPGKWLNAVGQMTSDEMLVYFIVCLRIYDSDGPCTDTLKALAVRTRLNRRRVSNALDSLFQAGKLGREGAGIMNGFAAEIVAERTQRACVAAKAASSRWEKDEQKQHNVDADAMRTQCHVSSTLLSKSSNSSKDSQEGKKESKNLLTENHSSNVNLFGVVEQTRPRGRHRLPRDWSLTPGLILWAKQVSGWSDEKINIEFRKFQTNHWGRGTKWERWDLAWHTWVMNEIEWEKRHKTRNVAIVENIRQDTMHQLSNGRKVPWPEQPKGLKTQRDVAVWIHETEERLEREYGQTN